MFNVSWHFRIEEKSTSVFTDSTEPMAAKIISHSRIIAHYSSYIGRYEKQIYECQLIHKCTHRIASSIIRAARRHFSSWKRGATTWMAEGAPSTASGSSVLISKSTFYEVDIHGVNSQLGWTPSSIIMGTGSSSLEASP